MKQENFDWITIIWHKITDRFTFVNDDVALFIACQAALESSYGKSAIALYNNNIFGMKVPTRRLSNCLGENRCHALYKNVDCCICDFFYWLQYNGFTRKDVSGKLESYIKKFKRFNYCPSPTYIDTILGILNNYKSNLNS